MATTDVVGLCDGLVDRDLAGDAETLLGRLICVTRVDTDARTVAEGLRDLEKEVLGVDPEEAVRKTDSERKRDDVTELLLNSDGDGATEADAAGDRVLWVAEPHGENEVVTEPDAVANRERVGDPLTDAVAQTDVVRVVSRLRVGPISETVLHMDGVGRRVTVRVGRSVAVLHGDIEGDGNSEGLKAAEVEGCDALTRDVGDEETHAVLLRETIGLRVGDGSVDIVSVVRRLRVGPIMRETELHIDGV